MSSSSSLETTGERPAFFLPVTRGDPNDPCASNDAEDWTLVQAEFFSGGGSEDGGLRGRRGRDRRRLLRGGRRANDGEDSAEGGGGASGGDVRKWVDDDGFVLDLMTPCTTTPPPPTTEEAATEAPTTEAATTVAATTTAAAAAKDEETGSPDEVDPAIDDKEYQVDEVVDDSEGVPSATEAPEVVATEAPEEEEPEDVLPELPPDVSEEEGDIMHTTPSPPVEDDGLTSSDPPSDDPPASFFGCLGGEGFDKGATADLSAVAAPLKLSYDYELRTSEVLTSEVLARFERDVAKDLADRLGLLDCAFGEEPTRRRILRAEVEGGRASVLALDGKPVDDDMAGAYRCEVPVQLTRPNSCAPMRGYMTAWVPRSSDVDRAALEASLLALVEEGMEADAYVNGQVVKASYVGARPPPSDPGAGDPSVGGAKETDETGRVQAPDASSDGGLPVMVIVGISVSALALLLAIVLTVVYVRKRRRSKYFSDGPRDSSGANGGGSSAARAALAQQRSEDLADPDDEHLLATDEKMDLRSVHSESTGSSTENHTYDEREMAHRYDTLYGRNDASIYREGSRKIMHTLSSTTVDYGEPVETGASVRGGDSSDVTPKAGVGATTTVLTAGSSLAAMGVIGSNLAARSFGSTDGRPEPGSPSSAEEVPPTPTSAMIEHAPTDATPFSESDSHVGTVREEEESVATSTTPGADSNARVNPPPREEARSYPWDPRTGAVGLPAIDGAPSMDSMDRDTFREERGPVGWA
ncbi:hypothetical protein ACHAWF_011658 [Thalassiosira exigua]